MQRERKPRKTEIIWDCLAEELRLQLDESPILTVLKAKAVRRKMAGMSSEG
jgi:hypothetical protein